MNVFDLRCVLELIKKKILMALKSLFLCGLFSVSSMVAAADVDLSKADLSKLPPPADKKGVTYEKDIKPLFETSCLKCHGAEKPKSKYRVESLEATIKGGSSDEAAVVPGKSDKSPLVLYVASLVEEMEMPPLDKRDKYPPLTKDQIALIRAWIDQGAK
jgi:hypothetical protein